MSDTNVGMGMAPHKKSCRCLECENERLQRELNEARAKLRDWEYSAKFDDAHYEGMKERAERAEKKVEDLTLLMNESADGMAKAEAKLSESMAHADCMALTLAALTGNKADCATSYAAWRAKQ